MSRSIRSLESQASSAFQSPTQLTAKRLGQRTLSPQGPPSSGASVGGQSRRSTSLIQNADDEQVFQQIGGATAVVMGTKQTKQPERARSPLLNDFMEGVENVMQGANSAAEMLMQSLSPTSCQPNGDDNSQEGGLWSFMSKPSMTSYGNQTATSAQRTPLDLHHNDNSFHVLANLLIDFLQTKLTADGSYVVLQPEDSVRMERVLPEVLRLDFIDAVVFRLANTPKVAKTPLDLLTLQCHELGIDREGSMNPILAAANLDEEPAYIPVQSVLDAAQTEERHVAQENAEGEEEIPSDESSGGRLSKNPTANSVEQRPTFDEGRIHAYHRHETKKADSDPPAEELHKHDEIDDVRQMVSEEISLASTMPESSTIPPINSKISSASQRSRSKSPTQGRTGGKKPPKSLEMIGNYVLEQDVSVADTAPTAPSVSGFKIPTMNSGINSILETNVAVPQEETLSPATNAGGFFSSMNPFIGFGFAGKCVPEPSSKAELERQKQELSMTIQRTFSESVVTSPLHAFQQDRELTLEDTKQLAKEQLYAEIREAQALITQSKSPETVAFWEEHVAELNDRIRALDENDDQDNESMTTTEIGFQLNTTFQPAAPSIPERLKSMSTRDGQTVLERLQTISMLDTHPMDEEPITITAAQSSVKAATTPTSPTRDSMHWKDEPNYDVPMVDVVAPADLPGGYHFEAELEGKRFLATVPAGGVKQGETFTCYMRELDSVAIDIPVGYWKDSMANVCTYGCCHPVFWNPIICPLTSLWQIQTRVGLDFLGRPLQDGSSPPVPNRTTLLTVLVSWIFINAALLAGYDYKWSRGLNLTFADLSAIGLVNLSMFAFLVFITQSTRSSLREKFMIREHRCSDLEDIYVSSFALPCTIAQMSRHTANYDDYEAVCCSKTGLPQGVRVNQQRVGFETDYEVDAEKLSSGYKAPAIV